MNSSFVLWLLPLASLALMATLSNGGDKTGTGTGTGNNGDEVEQVYERVREILVEKVYPRMLQCFSRRNPDPIFDEELAANETSREILQNIIFAWNSEWPDQFDPLSKCFHVNNQDRVFMSWDHCSVDREQFSAAVNDILQILFIKRSFAVDHAQKRAGILREYLESDKCGSLGDD